MARERLGGQCVRCGATENLDFDHIVPGSRTRKISEATNWTLDRFLTEVDKCQLLCHPSHGCSGHAIKSAEAGELIGSAKLTTDDVRLIRASISSDGTLAAQFGVQPEAIRRVRLRKTWKHVD